MRITGVVKKVEGEGAAVARHTGHTEAVGGSRVAFALCKAEWHRGLHEISDHLFTLVIARNCSLMA